MIGEQKDFNLQGKQPILRELFDQLKEEIGDSEKQSQEIRDKIMFIDNKKHDNDDTDLGKIPQPHTEDSMIMEFYNCIYRIKQTNKTLEENVKKLTRLVG